jgi:hypothetical protein
VSAVLVNHLPTLVDDNFSFVDAVLTGMAGSAATLGPVVKKASRHKGLTGPAKTPKEGGKNPDGKKPGTPRGEGSDGRRLPFQLYNGILYGASALPVGAPTK